MAINKRIMEKIRERAEGDERTLSILRDLIVFETDGPGQYVKEYEKILRKYALQEMKK